MNIIRKRLHFSGIFQKLSIKYYLFQDILTNRHILNYPLIIKYYFNAALILSFSIQRDIHIRSDWHFKPKPQTVCYDFLFANFFCFHVQTSVPTK